MSETTTIAVPVNGRIETTDSLGRKLVIQELDAMGKLDLFEACGTNSQNQPWVGMALMACSVIELDGAPLPRPQTRDHVRQAVKRLGDAGLAAVGKVLAPAAEPAGEDAVGMAGN